MGLVTGNICLEITERLLMDSAARISRMIAYLRRHGIAVALDDFGVNLSSLPYLHTLSFDSIKIDRRLICQFADDDKAESMIASLIVLAQGFKVPVVAEGIEDEAIKKPVTRPRLPESARLSVWSPGAICPLSLPGKCIDGER